MSRSVEILTSTELLGARENQQEIMLNLQGGQLAAVSETSVKDLQISSQGHDLLDLERKIL